MTKAFCGRGTNLGGSPQSCCGPSTRNNVMPFNQTICASCRRALQIGSRHSSFTGLKPALQTRRALSTATRSSDISPQQCRTFPRPQIPKTYRNANRINYARPFSSSKTIQKVILNPRQDEDGVEMSLSITPRASNVCHVFPLL